MSQERPLVSVVIPLYNGKRYLRETISTVINQDYRPIEIIIIDDGSTDGSGAVAQSFKEVRYVYQKNGGNARARDKGIEISRGEFIAFLDQDDLWAKNKLTVHVKYLIQHPEVYVTTSHFRFFLSPGVKRPAWCRASLLRGSNPCYTPSSLVARKAAFDIVGTFSSDFKTASDADWAFRAKDKNVPMFMIPQVLLYRRIHDANQSTQVATVHRELLNVIRRSIHRKRETEV